LFVHKIIREVNIFTQSFKIAAKGTSEERVIWKNGSALCFFYPDPGLYFSA
jgi:hypothetical protein